MTEEATFVRVEERRDGVSLARWNRITEGRIISSVTVADSEYIEPSLRKFNHDHRSVEHGQVGIQMLARSVVQNNRISNAP